MPRCLMAKKWKTAAYEKERDKSTGSRGGFPDPGSSSGRSLSPAVSRTPPPLVPSHSVKSSSPVLSSNSSNTNNMSSNNGNYNVIKSERLPNSPRPVITITSTYSLANSNNSKEHRKDAEDSNECNNNSNSSNNLNHSKESQVVNHQVLSNKEVVLSQSSSNNNTSNNNSNSNGTTSPTNSNNNSNNGNTPQQQNGNPWGPSSPTEGATAPSPPPSWLPAPTAGKVTVLFNGEFSYWICWIITLLSLSLSLSHQPVAGCIILFEFLLSASFSFFLVFSSCIPFFFLVSLKFNLYLHVKGPKYLNQNSKQVSRHPNFFVEKDTFTIPFLFEKKSHTKNITFSLTFFPWMCLFKNIHFSSAFR